MLQIDHLTITHIKDLRTVVSDLSLVLRPGDKAAIIGEEGNGKSTLLKLIHDPALVENYAEWTGKILKKGARLGYLPQELPAEQQEISAGEFWGGGIPLTPAQADKLLEELKIPQQTANSSQLMKSLSGGERIKLQLARILAQEPDVLLLDEPSNDLDLEALQWLEDFLISCPLAVLFVSHDETLLEKTANMIIHLEALRRKAAPRCTVSRVPYRDYVEARQSNFRHQAQVSRKEHDEFRKRMDRFMQIRNKVEHQQATITRQDPHGGRLLKKKMHAVQSMGRRFEKEKEKLTQMPEMEEAIFLRFPETSRIPQGKTVVDFSLPVLEAGGRILSRNIHLKVRGPEKVGIVGPNGCGKTTLLRLLFGELMSRTHIRCAYMPQNYSETLDLDRSPVDLLNHSGSRAEATRIRSHLGSLRFTTLEMDHPARELSGGQKAKLFFLQMVLDEANLLLLDEPTRNFSPLSGPVIRDILMDFGGAVISISHDRRYLEQVCDTIYALTPDGLIKL